MKKGEVSNAGAITALIIMIALFMALYVVLLPPEDRAKLLNQTYESSGVNEDEFSSNTLLLESPGLVSPVEDKSIEHNLNPINLFVKSEPDISLLADSLYISKGLFGGQDKSLAFSVENKEDIDKASLSFDVIDPKGTLNIELNGNIIFSEKIKRSGSKIIPLPVEFLLDRNELYIYSTNSFLGSSHFSLRNINLKKEYELVNSKEARTFSLSNSEFENIEDSRLHYFMFCNSLKTNSAILRVYINDKPLLIQTVRCVGGDRSVEIDKDYLKKGSNEILFVIDNGDFLFSDVKIVNELKESMFKTYYFGIDSDDWNKILNEEAGVVLEMVFDKDGGEKRADIRINNDIISISVKEDEYKKDITNFVEEGENIITIIPKEEFMIHSLRIKLE